MVSNENYPLFKENTMKQLGRNVRYIYRMKQHGYPLIGIYRGW